MKRLTAFLLLLFAFTLPSQIAHAQFNGCPPGFCSAKVASAPCSGLTWETGSATSVTFSNGNLTVANTGTTSPDQGAKVASASAKNTGKYYFELTWDAVGGVDMGLGVGTYASTYTSMGDGGGITGTENYRTGSTWSGGSQLNVGTGPWVITDVAGYAIDLDNRKFWSRKTPSSGWNPGVGGTPDPATNTGGLTIPAGTMVPFMTFGGSGSTVGRQTTVNFSGCGATPFNGTAPSGFSVWTP